MVLILIRQVPVYESSSVLRFPPPAQGQTADSYRIALNTDAHELLSSDLIGKAREQLNLSPQEATDRLIKIEANPLPDSQLVALTVASVDPVLSADFANALANVFIATRNAGHPEKLTVTQKAVPAASPITPRKISTIHRTALIGAGTGFLVAFITAGIIVGIQKNKGGEPAH